MNAEPLSVAPASSVESRVLVLPPTRADGEAIARLFASNELRFLICLDLYQLCGFLREGVGSVLVAEEAIAASPAGLIECIDAQPVWSDLPVIVLSRSGRESAELSLILGQLGNVSVVERPVRTSTLISLVRSSLRARARQYEVRQYLVEQQSAQQRVRESMDAERAARTEAERASRMKDEFLATMSHELRTPLNAILGWTQVMRRSRNPGQDVPNALNVIERNARAQAQIIQDLLDMSRIISGKVRLELQELDVAAVIDATIETVRPTAEARGVRLEVALESEAGTVRGDAGRLQQVLWNLLTNAVKFSTAESRVLVTLTHSDSQVQISVSDQGEGIDPQFLPQVFDRFRQADGSSTRRHGGLGLGLSIVKQIVELHGGSVSAESPGPGQGATFRVVLPRAAALEGVAEADSTGRHRALSSDLFVVDPVQDTDLAGLKVLVVDDEPDALSLVERLLRDCNANVVTASCAGDAVSAVIRESPDMLISDIGMPGEDGYELIRRVRALDGGRERMPAIALTAYARLEDRARAMASGFQLHLAKPVEPGELIAGVKKLASGR